MIKKLAIALFLFAFTQSFAADTTIADDPVLFFVNDEPVTETQYREFYASRGYSMPEKPEQQKLQQNKVVNELINIVLLSKQAETEKLDQSYPVQQALKVSRQNLLSKALVNKYLEEIQVSDEDRAAAYQQVLEGAKKKTEYKARYILLDNEDKAVEVIEKLKKGDDFKNLASQYSIEKFDNQVNASLEWFSLETQEKEIAEAISQLDTGKFNEKPVKSRFGWHIILLEDKKTPAVPEMAAMQNKLDVLVKTQKLRQQVAKLRESATVKSARQPSPAPKVE